MDKKKLFCYYHFTTSDENKFLGTIAFKLVNDFSSIDM